MTASRTPRGRPIAWLIARLVVSEAYHRHRRRFGRFGGTWEPTIRGYAPDLSSPTTPKTRSPR